jgi:protein TonB
LKKQRKPESFIRTPSYPGGKKAMDDFVKQHLRYPQEAVRNRVEGLVIVKADVDISGKVIDTKVKHGIGHGCDEEAMRVVKLMKFESIKLRGLHAVYHKTINILFRLSHPEPVQFNIVYNYIEKSKQ